MCLYIPRFYVQVERSRLPGLIGRPIVIGGLPDEKAYVIDCSQEARERGITLSMPLREAYHLSPDAAFLVFEDEKYRDIWEEILFALGAFALRMESKSCGVAYLDITKSMTFQGGEKTLASAAVSMLATSFGLDGKAGVGNSRFIAFQAALDGKTSVSFVAAGMERNFLEAIPVIALPVEDRVKERLRLLGLTHLGKLTSLSCQDLTSQFGKTGTLMWKIASGAGDSRKISKRRKKVQIEREDVFDSALETTGQLEEAVGKNLGEITSELKKIGHACRKLSLLLYFHGKECANLTLTFKDPTYSAEEILSRVMNSVSCMIIKGPIYGCRLSASVLSKTTGDQEGLFRKRHDLNEKLQGVKGYLATRYGQSTLFRVEEGEKDSRLPERRYVFKKV